jgi:hypothetical protein
MDFLFIIFFGFPLTALLFLMLVGLIGIMACIIADAVLDIDLPSVLKPRAQRWFGVAE